MTLVLLVLVAKPGPSATQGSPNKGAHFSVQCTQNDAGTRTCALVVTGLPEPLQHKIAVPLTRVQLPPQTPNSSVPSSTVVAAEAPAIAPGPPVLVSSQLPAPPPFPSLISPQVPEPPPKSV